MDFNPVTFRYFSFPGFAGGSEDKASACNAGDPGLIPGWERSLGEGNEQLKFSSVQLLSRVRLFAAP